MIQFSQPANLLKKKKKRQETWISKLRSPDFKLELLCGAKKMYPWFACLESQLYHKHTFIYLCEFLIRTISISSMNLLLFQSTLTFSLLEKLLYV